MSFDFSTLVTDRLQSDVDERNAKGTYNAVDLNRVTAAMEALDEMFRAYGYHSGYTPIFVASRGGQSGQLPEGYTRLQYIESSGTQWIDTGFKPNQLSRVVMDVNILTQSGWPRAVFGGRNGSTTAVDSFVFWAFDSTYFRSDYDTGTTNIDVSVAGRHSIDKNKNVCRVDGTTVTQPTAVFQSNYPMALFGQNDVDGIDERMVVMQLYGCQVYDNGILVRDFIPCESPDGAVGLYDAANGMFYGNAGTGDFAAGPEVPEPEPGPVLDPYTWYESDIPLQSQMAQYLANLAALRGVLSQVEAEPPTPESMALLTYVEANDIETILLQIEAVLTTIGAGFLRAGMPWAVAGGPEIFARNGGTA